MKHPLLLFLLLTLHLFTACKSKKTAPSQYSELSEEDFKHDSDIVNGDTVYYKTSTLNANENETLLELNDGDSAFLRESLQQADTLLNLHKKGLTAKEATPKILDDLIDAWNKDNTGFHCSRAEFISAVGATFGYYEVKTYHMKWKVLKDAYGTDYCTHLGELNVFNYPFSSVTKALDEKREGSLHHISLMTNKQIIELRKDPK